MKRLRGLRTSPITLVAVVVCMALAAGCTSSTRVAVNQANDRQKSCTDIKQDLAELDRTEAQIRSNKGATGTNILGALLWLPGYVYTQSSADEALGLTAERRAVLMQLAQTRGCPR